MNNCLNKRSFKIGLGLITILFFISCSGGKLSKIEKQAIYTQVKMSLDEGVEATRTKNIDLYMKNLPEGLIVFDESGEVISREAQRKYALRDWSIIDKTLDIEVLIDSIYISRDSLFVYTSQRWERMMYQRDGIATDTVLTTQRHKETWKKTVKGWFGYEVEELGGKIFINGIPYQQ